MVPQHGGVIDLSLKYTLRRPFSKCHALLPIITVLIRITWKRIVCESSILQYFLTFYLNAGSTFSRASGSAKQYRVMLVMTVKLSSIGPIYINFVKQNTNKYLKEALQMLEHYSSSFSLLLQSHAIVITNSKQYYFNSARYA